MSIELKPCPFCGQLPNVEQEGQNLKIACTNPKCEMHPTTRWRSTAKYGEQRVFDMWNMRDGKLKE